MRSVLSALFPQVRQSWLVAIAPLVLATASGAHAQTIIGPGTIGSTVDVNASNSPATVVGNTIITVPGGDGIDAPLYNEPGGILDIDTELGPSPGVDLDHQRRDRGG